MPDKTLTLSELTKWLKDIQFIIIDMNISINTALRILNRQDENERRIQHKFFFVLPQQMRFIIVVHLAKLFRLGSSRNDHRSFKLLFDKLENAEYDVELNELLTENQKRNEDYLFPDRKFVGSVVKDLKDEIQHYEDLISKILYVRNKAYAHLDPDREPKLIDFNDLPVLINLANSIFNKINCGFFGSTIAFEMTDEYDINKPLQMIAGYYKLMDDKYKS